MADNAKRIRLKVFRSLCRHSCDVMSSWIPLPCTVIAEQLGITLYQCRKAMKQLVAEGLAVKDSCSGLSEDCPLPYNGFRISLEGRKTGIFMYVGLQSARLFAKCFDGKLESFLPDGFDFRWLNKQETSAINAGAIQTAMPNKKEDTYGHYDQVQENQQEY